MNNLFETKLQKIILFLTGVTVFIRLLAVQYKETNEAILFTAGMVFLAFVLLIIFRGYEPNFKALKKYAVHILVLMVVFFCAVFFYLNNRRNTCVEEAVRINSNKIDYNAFLNDIEDDRLREIAFITGTDAQLLINGKNKNIELIEAINKIEIMYIASHPEWREQQLYKLRDIITTPKISESYISQLKNNCRFF
jgi:Ca2+/Na+ antiporter